MKKTKLCFMLLLVLPAVVHAQQLTPVPEDTVVVNLTMHIAKEMIRMIKAGPDCFNGFKGDLYLTDDDSNSYYYAKNVDLHTDRQYVDVKRSGEVSFVANWKPKKDDNTPMIAVTAFTTYILKVAGKDYVAEAPVRDMEAGLVRYYLKEAGINGKRVALFILKPVLKESTFIVDSGSVE